MCALRKLHAACARERSFRPTFYRRTCIGVIRWFPIVLGHGVTSSYEHCIAARRRLLLRSTIRNYVPFCFAQLSLGYLETALAAFRRPIKPHCWFERLGIQVFRDRRRSKAARHSPLCCVPGYCSRRAKHRGARFPGKAAGPSRGSPARRSAGATFRGRLGVLQRACQPIRAAEERDCQVSLAHRCQRYLTMSVRYLLSTLPVESGTAGVVWCTKRGSCD